MQNQVFHSRSADEVVRITDAQGSIPLTATADTLENALAKDLGSVPQVRHVLTERGNSSLLVWIAVDDPQPHVRRRIYQQELALIEGFPEVDFDFYLIPAMGRGAEEIATEARLVYSREG